MRAGNNKGYSLVELLLAIFILALVMAGVVSIMRATSVSYRNGNFEVNVQTEAQIVANQIEELLVDADTSVSYNSSNGIYTIVNHGVTHQLKYDSSESTIQYKSGSGSWSLMAEYVDGFSIDGISTDTSEVACDNKVTVNVTMNNQGYKYTAMKDVYYRNAIENTSVQLLGGTGSSTSASSSEKVIYVDVKRYDIIDIARDYNINPATLSISSELTNEYEFIEVDYNTDTSNKSLAKAILDPDTDITYPADPADITGYVRAGTSLVSNWGLSTDKAEAKYWVKGNYFDDPKTTSYNEALQQCKLVFYTDAVSYEMKTSSDKANSSGFAFILTPSDLGSGEMYIAYIEPKGVDLGMMLNTTENKIKFGMVAYQDKGGTSADLKYNGSTEKWTDNPVYGSLEGVGLSNAVNKGRSASVGGGWLNFSLAVDEESGALVIHQKEQIGNVTDISNAVDDGDKRIAVMLYIQTPTSNTTTFSTDTCHVIDFNLCMQGASISSYKGGNSYTGTFGAWGKSSLDF